jgi:FAD synthetase
MGHIYYLREAKKLGDTLVVVVATDTTVRKLKHDPITPQDIRVSLIKELKTIVSVPISIHCTMTSG